MPDEELDVLVSYSHTDEETENYLKEISIKSRVRAGSSLKYCLLAEGSADLYPRYGPNNGMGYCCGSGYLTGRRQICTAN